MDDAVDAMNRAAYKALTKVMEEQSHLAPQALNALMISRNLERVADHATNIAEDVIFWVQGATCATTRAGPCSGCRRRLRPSGLRWGVGVGRENPLADGVIRGVSADSSAWAAMRAACA
jgi:hypothetical protein